MIDNVSVFTKSGLVLWEEKRKTDVDPIENLVTNVFLEEKMHEKFYKTEDYIVYWTFQHGFPNDIVFVLVHKISMRTRKSLEYSVLIETVKKEFIKMYNDILTQKDLSPFLDVFEMFGKVYRRVLRCWIKTKGKKGMRRYFEKKGKDHEEKVDEDCDKLLEEVKNEKMNEVGKVRNLDRFRDDFGADDIDSVDVRITHKPRESKGVLGRMMESFTSSRQLGKKDLEPVLKDFRNHLVGKNVAEEVSRKICKSLHKSLLGKRIGRISTVHRTVKNSMKDSLNRILSPSRKIDIRTEILKNRERNEYPYSIVFCGVNGVGKTTTIAKVAFWLKSEGFSVLLCACDTFRSGAIEQLEVHSKCLGSEFFEMGYTTPPHRVANECLKKYHSLNDVDVVLIDTAGRMHHNQKLMASLCKLVKVNNPNLVLFVGESLVGNLAVEQAETFDRSLAKGGGHSVDGLILTKFDAIEDKVGATVSMVYTTGKPVVFIGNGQKYYHLKVLSPEDVVQFLLN